MYWLWSQSAAVRKAEELIHGKVSASASLKKLVVVGVDVVIEYRHPSRLIDKGLKSPDTEQNQERVVMLLEKKD